MCRRASRAKVGTMPNDDCHGGDADRPLLNCLDRGRAQLERDLLHLLVTQIFDQQRFDGLLCRLAKLGQIGLRIASDNVTATPDSSGSCRPAL